jgi:hypothetical protein
MNKIKNYNAKCTGTKSHKCEKCEDMKNSGYSCIDEFGKFLICNDCANDVTIDSVIDGVKLVRRDLEFKRMGYDSRGFDHNGIHYASKTHYDNYDCDREGFERSGFNQSGIHKSTGTQYDPDGYDNRGFDVNGISRATQTKYGEDSYDRDGYNCDGFNNNLIHRITGTKNDPDGLDAGKFKQNGINSITNTDLDSDGDDYYNRANISFANVRGIRTIHLIEELKRRKAAGEVVEF